MPSYTVDLKSPDSKETRQFTNIEAASEAKAKQIVEEKEQRVVEYQMDVAELDQAKAAEKDGVLVGTLKGHYAAHRQQKPYKITSVKKNEGK